MAYCRGKNYIWADEAYYHLWIGDGKDASAYDLATSAEYPEWASIKVPFSVLDDFVLSRFMEMLESEDRLRLIEDVERLSRENGNFGVDCLRRRKKDMIAILTAYGKTLETTKKSTAPNNSIAEGNSNAAKADVGDLIDPR